MHGLHFFKYNRILVQQFMSKEREQSRTTDEKGKYDPAATRANDV
jgi:hypothetical protein